MTDYLYEIDLRPRFIDLWRKHHFRSDTLAAMAEVPEETILTMFRDEAVEESVATSVLAALSRLTDSEYTLNTVRVKLHSSTKGKNE
jgi:hypothetical protein